MPRPFRCRVSLDWGEPHARDLLAGIVEVARSRGWTLTDSAGPADGTIVDSTDPRATSAPLAVRVSVRDEADVYADPAAAARLAVEHLLARGFRHLAHQESSAVAAAIEAAVATTGHTTAHVLSSTADFATLPRPIGIVAADDLSATAVLRMARSACLNVPGDVAIVGRGDDAVLCDLADVPLSSIDVNARAIGRRAALRLDRLRRGRPPGEPEPVPPRGLTARASTNTLAVTDAEVAAAVRLLHEGAAVALRVPDLMRASGLDRRTLERRFRGALGRSPAEAIRRHRAARAAELLRSTTLPIAEIARSTGFRLPQHLAVTLKAVYGQTPTDLRAASV